MASRGLHYVAPHAAPEPDVIKTTLSDGLLSSIMQLIYISSPLILTVWFRFSTDDEI